MEELARARGATAPQVSTNASNRSWPRWRATAPRTKRSSSQEFLDLIDRSRAFLEEKDLIDLPEHETLFTALSPSHFAGAAVGGVYSAGPFDPEAETLFYLPSVPDSAPRGCPGGFLPLVQQPLQHHDHHPRDLPGPLSPAQGRRAPPEPDPFALRRRRLHRGLGLVCRADDPRRRV